VLIAVNEEDPRPIYRQIASQVKEQVRIGDLRPGDELPSVRELAASLAVNLHTVHRAYRELREQGIVTLRLGRRARVAPVRRTPPSRKAVESRLGGRLRELVAEAYHLGLSGTDFRSLVEDVLDTTELGGRQS
jgi:GntR family transcriptional regulator